jgi:hypothetical protein
MGMLPFSFDMAYGYISFFIETNMRINVLGLATIDFSTIDSTSRHMSLDDERLGIYEYCPHLHQTASRSRIPSQRLQII